MYFSLRTENATQMQRVDKVIQDLKKNLWRMSTSQSVWFVCHIRNKRHQWSSGLYNNTFIINV